MDVLFFDGSSLVYARLFLTVLIRFLKWRAFSQNESQRKSTHLRFFVFLFVCGFFSQFLQDSSTFLLRCQRDEQSIQIMFREMLQKETNQLEKDGKRLEKQLQKTLDKLDKLQKKNQKLEKEISNLELDPKVLEDRDHELRVQLDALESTNKSLRNVTNNQKSEFEAMRRAAQEFEDALKVSQVRNNLFSVCRGRNSYLPFLSQEELNADKNEIRILEKVFVLHSLKRYVC